MFSGGRPVGARGRGAGGNPGGRRGRGGRGGADGGRGGMDSSHATRAALARALAHGVDRWTVAV
eukprot:6822683-Prymnesium_polylepis.1